MTRSLPTIVVSLFFAAALAAVSPQPAYAQGGAAPDAQQQQQPLSNGELDALMAPVALYPDVLLSKILIASTFPDQVQAAAQWQQANPNVKGAAIDNAIAGQN
jgi:hypothetical protein